MTKMINKYRGKLKFFYTKIKPTRNYNGLKEVWKINNCLINKILYIIDWPIIKEFLF